MPPAINRGWTHLKHSRALARYLRFKTWKLGFILDLLEKSQGDYWGSNRRWKMTDQGWVDTIPSAFGFKNDGIVFSNPGVSIIIQLKRILREFSIMFSIFLLYWIVLRFSTLRETKPSLVPQTMNLKTNCIWLPCFILTFSFLENLQCCFILVIASAKAPIAY